MTIMAAPHRTCRRIIRRSAYEVLKVGGDAWIEWRLLRHPFVLSVGRRPKSKDMPVMDWLRRQRFDSTRCAGYAQRERLGVGWLLSKCHSCLDQLLRGVDGNSKRAIRIRAWLASFCAGRPPPPRRLPGAVRWTPCCSVTGDHGPCVHPVVERATATRQRCRSHAGPPWRIRR